MIKILVVPELENFEQDQRDKLMELELKGHQAIVRTVCFNPLDPTMLLSGGHMENDIKVWDNETGVNVANL